MGLNSEVLAFFFVVYNFFIFCSTFSLLLCLMSLFVFFVLSKSCSFEIYCFSHIGMSFCCSLELEFSLQFRGVKIGSKYFFIKILSFFKQKEIFVIFTILKIFESIFFTISPQLPTQLFHFIQFFNQKVSHFSQHFFMFFHNNIFHPTSFSTACNSHPKKKKKRFLSLFIYIAAADTKKKIFHMIIIYKFFFSSLKIRQSKLFSV